VYYPSSTTSKPHKHYQATTPYSAHHHSTPKPYGHHGTYGQQSVLDPYDLVDAAYHKDHLDFDGQYHKDLEHIHLHKEDDEAEYNPFSYKVKSVEGHQLPIRPFRHGFAAITSTVPPYAAYNAHANHYSASTPRPVYKKPKPNYSHADLAAFGHSTPIIPFGHSTLAPNSYTTEHTPTHEGGTKKLYQAIQVTLRPRGDQGLHIPEPYSSPSNAVATYAVPPATKAPIMNAVSTLPPYPSPSKVPIYGPRNTAGPKLNPIPAVPGLTTKAYPYGKPAQEGHNMPHPKAPLATTSLPELTRAKRRLDQDHLGVQKQDKEKSRRERWGERARSIAQMRSSIKKLPIRPKG
jgi:hypothetical protein